MRGRRRGKLQWASSMGRRAALVDFEEAVLRSRGKEENTHTWVTGHQPSIIPITLQTVSERSDRE